MALPLPPSFFHVIHQILSISSLSLFLGLPAHQNLEEEERILTRFHDREGMVAALMMVASVCGRRLG